MPIAPTACRYQCPRCNWSTVFTPRSDALTSAPPRTCPNCGHGELTYTALRDNGLIAGTLRRILGR